MTNEPWRPLTVGTRRAAPKPDGPRPGIRGPTPEDKGYVSDGWLRQMADVDRDYSRGARWGQAGRHVDIVLDRPDTRALIVHAGGDPGRILAWVVYAEGPTVPVIHFAYTRKEERGKGYAKALLARAGVVTQDTALVYTCRGPSERLLLRAYKAASYHALYRFLGLPGQYEDPGDRFKNLPPNGERR